MGFLVLVPDKIIARQEEYSACGIQNGVDSRKVGIGKHWGF